MWRTWENPNYYFKPAIINREQNLNELRKQVDIHLQMISYLEPRYDQLIWDIAPFNQVTIEMI